MFALPLLSCPEIMQGCYSIGLKVGEDLPESVLYVQIDLQKGGRRRGRKESILLSRQQALALAPTQTDTNSASELREEGCVCVYWCVCVCVCGETRGKGSSRLSKANRKASLPQVQLLWAEAGGDDKEEGGVIVRVL